MTISKRIYLFTSCRENAVEGCRGDHQDIHRIHFSFSISWKNEGIRLNFHQSLEFYVSCIFLNLWNFFNFFILTEWKYCSRLTFLQKNKKTKTVSKMLIYLLLLFSWQFSVEMDDCIVTNMNTTHTRFSSFEEISVSLFFSNRSERADCSDWIK